MRRMCSLCGEVKDWPEPTARCPECLANAKHVLSVWQISKHPADFPNDYTLREFRIERGATAPVPSPHVLTGPTLESVRAMLPPFLHRLPRDPSDQPHIVESWI